MTNKIYDWVKEQYEPEIIHDIVKHGCVSGFPNLTYYHETIKFHDDFEEIIWDMLYNDAEDQGCTVMELIAQFNGQKDVGSMTQLKNLLAWYAVEQVCYQIVNEDNA